MRADSLGAVRDAETFRFLNIDVRQSGVADPHDREPTREGSRMATRHVHRGPQRFERIARVPFRLVNRGKGFNFATLIGREGSS